MPTYSENPQYWWETKGGRYMEEREKEEALDTETLPLFNLVMLPEVGSVLEVGCGYGRLLRPLAFFRNVREVAGFDFSNSQLENAKKYLDGLGIILEQHDLSSASISGRIRNYLCYGFDLVFTHGVFTHIPPFQIKKTLMNLIQFSNKYIVLIEFELREGKEIKTFDDIKFNEIGQYMAAGDTDTWAYDFESMLDKNMELEKINVFRNFKTSPFGHTTYIYRKKSFYEVVKEIDEIL